MDLAFTVSLVVALITTAAGGVAYGWRHGCAYFLDVFGQYNHRLPDDHKAYLLQRCNAPGNGELVVSIKKSLVFCAVSAMHAILSVWAFVVALFVCVRAFVVG